MEPDLASQLGVESSSGPDDSSSLISGGILDQQRLDREATGGLPNQEAAAPPDPSTPEARIADLERQLAEMQKASPTQQEPDPIEIATKYQQDKLAEIDRDVMNAYYGYMANEVPQGLMTQEDVVAKLTDLRERALVNVNAAAQTLANLPAIRRTNAERVAKQFQVGEIKITVDDLLPYAASGPEAMRVRAKTIQEERRNAGYQKRVRQGTDRAEAGAGTTVDPRALDRMSAAQIIKLGVQRGHFS